MIRLVPIIVALLMALQGTRAAAQDAPQVAAPWRLSASGGAMLFTTSQSKVVSHLIKPDVRIGFSYAFRGLLIGAEVQAVASSEAGYRLVGALATLGVPLYCGSVFELDLNAAAGPGSDARILHYDLLTEYKATLWGRLGLGFLWWLPGDNVALGLSLDSLNLSTVAVDLTLTLRL